jgi:hypothetical protein
MMGRRGRFFVWVAVVALILAGVPAWLALARRADDRNVLVCGYVLFTLASLVVLGLLWTTPRTAIRLRPWTSIVTIALGAAWLHAWAIAMNSAGVVESHLLMAGISVVASALTAIALIRWRRSPWWSTILGWHPVMLGGSLTLRQFLIVAIGVALTLIVARCAPASSYKSE